MKVDTQMTATESEWAPNQDRSEHDQREKLENND